MKACVIKLSELFRLRVNSGQTDLFSENRRKLVIPLYQREYKWEIEKVEALVNDVKRNAKFIGNIILDEKETCYEIVDGQQRITTCLLALVAMYNYYKEHPMEQESLLGYMQPYGDWILQNQSVGGYLTKHEGKIDLCIMPENDVYHQTDKFSKVTETLETWFANLPDRQEDVRDFKVKLLDCEVLVLINTNHEHTRPVEQLFLDINEKSQQLDVEDVFKGHCFENYDDECHERLKSEWIDFKKTAMNFKDFGFKDVDEYIYVYLLETTDQNMPQKLTIKGRHYLEGKTMDDTHTLLNNMTEYGKANITFFNNLNTVDYDFSNLCADSHAHNNTSDKSIMKQMCTSMLKGTGSAIYQKIPLLNLVYILSISPQIVTVLAHNDFRKILTNLYVYMSLFIFSGQRKSKQQIDYSVRDSLKSESPIQATIRAAQQLRKAKVEDFTPEMIRKGAPLYFIYSVIDFYNKANNWITRIYSTENGDTDEHFIIADSDKVRWIDRNRSIELTEMPKAFIKENKKKAINYLIIPQSLNGSLGHDDIITKIQRIRDWFMGRNETIPHHIETIFTYIENMPEYGALCDLKGSEATDEEIKAKYIDFWNAYFNDDKAQNLLRIIAVQFKRTFSD